MRKRLIYLLIVTIMILTGCGEYSKTYQSKKTEIEEYNQLVKDTLIAYERTKTFAETQQEYVEGFIFEDKYFKTLVESDVIPPLLTPEQKDIFSYRSIIYNDFYTSLGADTVRQVIVVKGKNNYVMTVIILWSEDKIKDFKRDVKQL